MDCQRAQLVLSSYIANDLALSDREHEAFESHLRRCAACAREYQETKAIIALVRANWTVSDDTLQLLGKTDAVGSGMMVEGSRDDLKHRIPELVRLDKRQGRLKVVRRIGTAAGIAASVALVVTIGWMVFRSPRAQTPAVAVLKPAQPMASAELITPSGKTAVPFGQPIVSKDRRQEILLGGMHRVVMNTDTAVTFNWIDDSRSYDVTLARGELYAEVIPGHAFTVKTPNANLVITGTKFNVRYADDQTDLTLVKGSVRFGNHRDEWTDVTAGSASTVRDDAKPTAPQTVDAVAVTAWARQLAVENTLANMTPPIDYDLSDMIRDSWHSWPPKLDELDYETWTERERDWFRREFPWIFKAERILTDNDIDTDYVTLLMVSGDIWQFRYPASWGGPMAKLDPAGIERIEKYYDVDLAEPFRLDLRQAATEQPSSQEALLQWRSDIADAVGGGKEFLSDLLLFSLRATHYLANTHTAAVLWIKTYPDQALRLLKDPSNASEHPWTRWVAGWIDSEGELQELVEEHLAAIHQARYVAEELLTTPAETAGCASEARSLAEQLASLLKRIHTEAVKK